MRREYERVRGVDGRILVVAGIKEGAGGLDVEDFIRAFEDVPTVQVGRGFLWVLDGTG